MEEIKLGEYVRNKKGEIFQYVAKENLEINEFMNVRGNRDITKHGQNITELIEAGDYVNGCEVTQVTATQLIVRDENGLSMWNKKDVEKHIKHIVTHEQFNSIKYTVGE